MRDNRSRDFGKLTRSLGIPDCSVQRLSDFFPIRLRLISLIDCLFEGVVDSFLLGCVEIGKELSNRREHLGNVDVAGIR